MNSPGILVEVDSMTIVLSNERKRAADLGSSGKCCSGTGMNRQIVGTVCGSPGLDARGFQATTSPLLCPSLTRTWRLVYAITAYVLLWCSFLNGPEATAAFPFRSQNNPPAAQGDSTVNWQFFIGPLLLTPATSPVKGIDFLEVQNSILALAQNKDPALYENMTLDEEGQFLYRNESLRLVFVDGKGNPFAEYYQIVWLRQLREGIFERWEKDPAFQYNFRTWTWRGSKVGTVFRLRLPPKNEELHDTLRDRIVDLVGGKNAFPLLKLGEVGEVTCEDDVKFRVLFLSQDETLLPWRVQDYFAQRLVRYNNLIEWRHQPKTVTPPEPPPARRRNGEEANRIDLAAKARSAV
jgi:hypothetical protein